MRKQFESIPDRNKNDVRNIVNSQSNKVIQKKLQEQNPDVMFLDTSFLKDNEIFLKLVRTSNANVEKNWLPAYYFTVCGNDGTEYGYCDLRIGHNENVYYGGNIGYGINEEYRGRHYAGKACFLLFELARRHNLEYLIITCNPENIASRKTCEYAGGILKEIVDLPEYNDMYLEGERQKCIYYFKLS